MTQNVSLSTSYFSDLNKIPTKTLNLNGQNFMLKKKKREITWYYLVIITS